MNKFEIDRATARRVFSERCIGKNEKFHDGNCGYCCLRGIGIPNTCMDGGIVQPNYSGWERLYVEAGRAIPSKFAAAFLDTIQNCENKLYVVALKRAVAHFGLSIEK